MVSRRLPSGDEAASLGPGMIVVECQLGEDGGQFGAGGSDAAPAAGPGRSGTVELAMGEAAPTGLLAWLEAAPPGFHRGAALEALPGAGPPAPGTRVPRRGGRRALGV